MSFSNGKFNKLKSNFVKATKKVLKENIPSNEEELREYEKEITLLHNKVINYVSNYFTNFNEIDKTYYRKELVHIRDKTNKCFGRLSSRIRVVRMPCI